jgi:hypothetical protein
MRAKLLMATRRLNEAGLERGGMGTALAQTAFWVFVAAVRTTSVVEIHRSFPTPQWESQ